MSNEKVISSKIVPYLELLPDIYKNSDKTDFLADFLKIFEAILSGSTNPPLAETAGLGTLLEPEIIGNLFYPQFSFLFPTSAKIEPLVPPPPAFGDSSQDDKPTPLEVFIRLLGVANYQKPDAEALKSEIQQLRFEGKTDAEIAAMMPWVIAKQIEPEFEDWLDDFVTWLGSWVDLTNDPAWSLDKKRQVLAEIMPLYRGRGTLDFLQTMAGLWFDDAISQLWKSAGFGENYEEVTGNISRYLFIYQFSQTLQYTDSTKTMGLVGLMGATGLRSSLQGIVLGQTTLEERFTPTYRKANQWSPTLQLLPGSIVAGERPGFFSISLYLPTYMNPDLSKRSGLWGGKGYPVREIQTLMAGIKTVTDRGKPEFSSYQLLVQPTFQLGISSVLGQNTLLLSAPGYPGTFMVGDAILGTNTILADGPPPPPANPY